MFLVIAFGLGAVREGLLRPRIGEPKAHVIGTLIAVALMMLVIYAFIRQIHGSCSMTDLILIGVIWLIIGSLFRVPGDRIRRGCRPGGLTATQDRRTQGPRHRYANCRRPHDARDLRFCRTTS